MFSIIFNEEGRAINKILVYRTTGIGRSVLLPDMASKNYSAKVVRLDLDFNTGDMTITYPDGTTEKSSIDKHTEWPRTVDIPRR